MSPYVAYGVGLVLFGLSVVTGGLWWTVAVVLVVVAREKQVKERAAREMEAERMRCRRQVHRLYAD